jgi:hypothetical protein
MCNRQAARILHNWNDEEVEPSSAATREAVRRGDSPAPFEQAQRLDESDCRS